MNTVTLTVNGRETSVPAGASILEAARTLDIAIPTLCFHKELSTLGSCWMCIVELKGKNRFVPACSTAVTPGMDVETDNGQLRLMRTRTVERLLEQHCGDCEAPCTTACPAGCNIPAYTGAIRRGDDSTAIRIITETIPLAATLGRICPAPCEDACRRHGVDEPVAICSLKRFAADRNHNAPQPYIPVKAEPSGKKVAVIGAGPAGLSTAYYLLQDGHDVTVYDANSRPGGMMYYAIPRFRLPENVLEADIAPVAAMGGNMVTGMELGKDMSPDELNQNGYDAIFLAIGAGKAADPGIPGQHLSGIMSGIAFLKSVATGNSPDPGKDVIVVGGGNTAVDAARTALRLGARNVTLLYRRTREEMPANRVEIGEAEAEGISLKLLSAPVSVSERNGRLELVVQDMKPGEPDESGRRRPVPVEGSVGRLEADTIITAIGQQVDASLTGLLHIETTPKGTITIDPESFQTSNPWIFAGGDCVTGAGIAVTAVGQGRKAAAAISRYLNGEPPSGTTRPFNSSYGERDHAPRALYRQALPLKRMSMHELTGAERITSFSEVCSGLTEEQARQEASRCLRCSCNTKNDCTLRELATHYEAELVPDPQEAHENDYIVRNGSIRFERDKCIDCGICTRTIQETRNGDIETTILTERCPTGALS